MQEQLILICFLPYRSKLNMILAKPLDRAISNIKYPLGKYYVRMGLTPLPKVRVCRDFLQPPSGPLRN